MGKRKRESEENDSILGGRPKIISPQLKTANLTTPGPGSTTTIQIIAGSYEKVLHGFTAKVSEISQKISKTPDIEFEDNFLFEAHSAAIRCLALSPTSSSADAPHSQKVILASGSTDERINLYHLSALPAPAQNAQKRPIPSLAGKKITENPDNRELGALLHHSSGVNALYFPSRSKLLSAAEDNTIAVTRTRDWAVLSTIKVPKPKAMGRPSGDTAPLGGTPAGVNDFAVHPSMKLMISVGKGEKCMRLWNLVTGKKAGVLSFERDMLQGVGEGKWSSGEGKRVEWNTQGDEFAVGFERGAVIFGMDSRPKFRVLPSPSTKLHQIHYIAAARANEKTSELLALSTEDGRILFYSMCVVENSDQEESNGKSFIPTREPFGQLGGSTSGLNIRIKDFEVLKLSTNGTSAASYVVVAGSSDGSIRLWSIDQEDLAKDAKITTVSRKKESGRQDEFDGNGDDGNGAKDPSIRQVGHLLGTYETGNRITCLKAFVMHTFPEDITETPNGEAEDEFNGIQDSDEDSNNG